MNYKRHENDLKKLLFTGRRKSVSEKTGKVTYPKKHYAGVYVISRDEDDTVFKIGMAWGKGGLANRLNSYKICFPHPEEYFVHMLIITTISNTKNQEARLLEKILLKQRSLQKKIKATEGATGKHSLEYRIVSKRSVLNNAIRTVLDKNRELWMAVIVFGSVGWKIIPNDFNAVKGLQRPTSGPRATRKTLFDGVDLRAVADKKVKTDCARSATGGKTKPKPKYK
jgi:hypothetical protein